MTFAHIIGVVNTYVILTVFYFVFLLPYGVANILKRRLRRSEQPAWVVKRERESSLEQLKRTF